MRIEQYFLMTDYSLWEVILNGDSPIPTRVIDGVVQRVAPTTVDQRLAKKNELKPRGTLLMALPDKHQLKFNIHKDAKSLMKAVEKRLQKLISQLEILGESISQKDINLKFLRSLPIEWRTHTLIWRNKTDLEDQSLDDLFNSLKIYEAKVKSSSSTSPTTQNIAFISSQNTDSTNESVSAVTSVFAASTKVLVSALPNVDTLNDAVIYFFFASHSNSPQIDNDDLKQIDADDLEEVDLKWQMAMLTMRARRLLQRTRRNLGSNGTTSIGFDMSKVECYNCHRRGHFARECSMMVLVAIIRASRQMKNQQTMPSWHSPPQVLQVLIMRDNALVDLRKKFEKAKQERDELKLKLENFKNSSKNLSKLLASQISDKTRLGYDNQVFNSTVFDSDALISFESDVSMPTSPVHDRYKSGEGYHVVPPPYTGTFIPPKPDFVFHDALTVHETVHPVFNIEPSPTKPNKDLSQHVVPIAVLIRSRLVPLNATRPANTVVPQTKVPHQRPTKHGVTKAHSPIRRPINLRPLPTHSNFHQQVTTVKPTLVNAVQGVKGNWVWKPKCLVLDHVCRHTSASMTLKQLDYIDALGKSRYMTGNISYLSDFEEINGRYVPFDGNLKGDTECIVLSSGFKLPDENHVLLRVHRENIMYNVNLKNIVPSRDLTCLFAKATLDESNIWHRRLGHINFKTMNKLVKGNFVRGLPSKGFENNHTCVACKKGKQHRASCKTKPVSSVSQPLQRSYNGTEFKNQDLNQFCRMKGIKREFSVARTPQQNGIVKRKNRTLIDATRTILADSLVPISFWAEAVNTACYVQNRVLVTKPHNKTPYELLLGRTPSIGFIRLFGCPVTILNTLDLLGKFDGKANEGFLVGYSVSSKAFRVFNTRTKVVQETLHINFLENQPNVAGSRPTWLFDTDTLTQSMNYQPVVVGNQPNSSTGIQEHFDADKAGEGNVQQYVLLLLWSTGSKDLQNTDANATFNVKEPESEVHVFSMQYTNDVNAASTPVPTVEPNLTNSINTFSAADMPTLEDITYSDDEEDVGVEADFSNLETNITVSHIPTTRVHKDHPVTQIMYDLSSAPQTRSMTRMVKEQDLPKGKRAIGSKWVFRNKKDERGIVIRNKAQLVAQGHTQEEGIDYDEVFTLVAKIKAIRLFLAYASFMGFVEYQMDVKSAFLYGTIKEEVYVCQPPGFEDHDYPYKVYKVVKTLYGLHQAPRAWYETLANYLLENGFHRGLQLKQKQDGIFISQDKYLAKILRKFRVTDGKSASTPIDTEKPLLKDPDGEDVDVHTYRSMIGSLMYLTSSRLDILFAVCACAHFQVTPKALHLHAVKRIFWYLKGKPHLGLWYLKDSPFNLVAYSDSDYAGASLDIKSTTGVESTLPSSPHQSPIAQPSSHPPQQPPFNDAAISMNLLNQLLETCAHLTKKVGDFEQDKIAQTIEITKLKQRVRGLEKKRKLKASGLKRSRKGEIAELDVDEDVTLEEVAAEVAKDADAEPTKLKKVIEVVTTTKLMTKVVTAAATTIIVAPMPKASAARRRKGVVIRGLEETATPSVIDEAYARELEVELNANINWNEVIEQVKRKEKQDNTVMIYQALKRKPQTEAQERKNMVHFNSIVAFLEKGEKELEEEASKQSKRKSETSEEKAAKKHKPDKEVDELKTHIQIVPNDEDDVYTEATHLALKVPIVDYQIHTEHKKPYYKIIRADGTNQLFLSFISLLRNFNREDLEMLWKIV
nr:ribonuclease H-like domain-containing protein [Tanacetum cinerariifolium]